MRRIVSFLVPVILAVVILPTLARGQSQLINGDRVIVGSLNYCTDAGSSDTYACNLSPPITNYLIGTRYTFKANTANTANSGVSTLNLNSIGARTIKKVVGGITTDLAVNDIRAGQMVDVIYDGTNMQMLSQLGNAASGSGDFSSNTSTSVDSEFVLFSGTAGKTGKRATGSGLVTATSGVYGTVTAPSGTVVGTTDTQTLTNKRLTPRVSALTDAATVAINSDGFDMGTLATLAQNSTIGTDTGAPVDGQKMTLRIKSTVARTLTWSSGVAKSYRGGTMPCPASTTGSSLTDYIGLIYNGADSRWDCVSFASGY